MTEIRDTSQVFVFPGMVLENLTSEDELFRKFSGGNQGAHILQEISDLKVPIFKLVSVTADGVAAMIGHINGFTPVPEDRIISSFFELLLLK